MEPSCKHCLVLGPLRRSPGPCSFFQHIDRIGAESYEVTQEDILRARLRTSGIVEKTFQMTGVSFK